MFEWMHGWEFGHVKVFDPFILAKRMTKLNVSVSFHDSLIN
jgi:hypothetical protein